MRPPVRAVLAFALATGFLVALGFGLTRDPRVLPAVAVGKQAPPFELTSLDGRQLSLADLRGRPVLVNFWASWCTECKKEHPLLMELYARYGDRVAFVGIVFEDSAANARRYLTEMDSGPALRRAGDVLHRSHGRGRRQANRPAPAGDVRG